VTPRLRSWLAASLLLAVLAGVASAQAILPGSDDEDVPGAQDSKKENSDRGRTAIELRRTTPDVLQAGSIDPKTYVIGPGDLLEIELWGKIARVLPLEVSPEGKVFLPGRGTIDIAGQTLAEVRERMLKTIADQYVGVHADLRLLRLRSFKVYVTGLVRVPGAIQANSATLASEAVARVGLSEDASRRNIEIRRRDGASSRLDLDLFEIAGQQGMNPQLQDGDFITVPRATQFIDVAGAVGRPGHYELTSSDSLSTLFALAGGLLPAAVRERALMVRFKSPSVRESLWVDLSDTPDRSANFALQDGDHVFVQYRADFHQLPTVGILGEVQKPGSYPIVLGRDRFSDLIRWAGGFLPEANRSAIHLIREPVSNTDRDPEFDRLARLSRQEMTESSTPSSRPCSRSARTASVSTGRGCRKGSRSSTRCSSTRTSCASSA
jgi:protein involved in polysaccharide export with SLBB domain